MAVGTVSMEIGHNYVKTLELMAKIEAEKAWLEAMKAANIRRQEADHALAYGEIDFTAHAEKLEIYANELNEIWKDLKRKDDER